MTMTFRSPVRISPWRGLASPHLRTGRASMADQNERDALIDAVLTELRHQLEAELPSDTATLDEIEAAVTRIGGKLRRDLQEQIVQRRSGGPRDNRSACPHCGHLARYRDM